MKQYFDTVFNQLTSRPLVGAQVRVLDNSDGSIASIYASDGGASIDNPFTVQDETTSSPGFFSFWADAGFYDIEYLYGGSVIKTIKKVDLGTDVTHTELSASTGAEKVGADDDNSGSDYTTVAGFIEKTRSSSGSDLIGFLPSGTGAVARTVQDELREAVGATPFDFGASGDGTTDDAAALQKWLDRGGKLHVPKGYTFKTSVALSVNVAGTQIDGQGTIACTQRISGGVIEAEADDCILRGFTISNPGAFKDADATEQAFGALAKANRTRFENLNILDFEMGLGTDASGEFYDTFYLGNYIRVNGCGPGTPDDASGDGEDRGDGITHWGGRAVIGGNIIVPKDDTDCRAGIFCEQLDDFADDTTGADNARAATIFGNIVTIADSQDNGGGRFRRGIDCEKYRQATISDNTVRGVTWMAIQAAGDADQCVITGNSIYYDLPASNANGASWSPNRSGIHVYPNGGTINALTITGNSIVNACTDTVYGILINGITTGVVKNAVVAGNNIQSTVDTAGAGFVALDLAAGSSVFFSGNRVSGDWQTGSSVNNVPVATIIGNEFDGFDGFCINVTSTAKSYVKSNVLRNAGGAIETSGATLCLIEDNIIDTMASLFISNSGTTEIRASGNTVREGGGTVSDFGNLTVSRWRNNIGWSYLSATSTYDPASVAANSIGGASSGITVTGAKAGDRVTASWSAVTQGLVPMAAVSAANTVIASFANPTGSGVDLASGTVTVSVERG